MGGLAQGGTWGPQQQEEQGAAPTLPPQGLCTPRPEHRQQHLQGLPTLSLTLLFQSEGPWTRRITWEGV